jgi:D-glycero-alpha-D-manno-heptose-7-phosphate kinase
MRAAAERRLPLTVGAIVARAPLRVALGGGGTDLPAYYRESGGFVVSAAIDRYVHMLISADLQPRFRLKHLEWEETDSPDEVRHPILRVALERHWDGPPVELASVSDAPPGTGLGSSGAYAVCAIHALRAAAGASELEPVALAEEACEIEIGVLGREVGKQDQYAAALGGVRAYSFRADDTVDARELDLSPEVLGALDRQCLLFFTGTERSASDVLSRVAAGDRRIRSVLDRLQELARATCAALEAGDLARFADLTHDQWETKRERAPGTITPGMDSLRGRALAAGATGVISLGAGGGGFVLVYSPDPERTRAGMVGTPELPFGLDRRGAVARSAPFE